MPNYVGLLTFKAPKSGADQLEVGKHARALAELRGCRIIVSLWTGGDPDMMVVLQTPTKDQGKKFFKELGDSRNATIKVQMAQAEWEKAMSVADEK